MFTFLADVPDGVTATPKTSIGGDLVIQTGGEAGGDFIIKNPLRPEITDLSSLLDIVMKFLLPLGGIILFMMLLYAGYMYMTSKGDPEKVKSAHGIISSAIIGFILLVSAFLIVQLVGFIFGFSGGILPTG